MICSNAEVAQIQKLYPLVTVLLIQPPGLVFLRVEETPELRRRRGWVRLNRHGLSAVSLLRTQGVEPLSRLTTSSSMPRSHPYFCATQDMLASSCPSAANPDVGRCHTTLALAFMQKRYPKLDVRMPEGV